MPTYVLIVTLTDKGKKNFKEGYTATRDQLKKAVEKAGGRLTGYVTAGPIDAVEILDVPNDDAALSMLLGALSVDEIKVMSLRAFPEDEVKKALKNLP